MTSMVGLLDDTPNATKPNQETRTHTQYHNLSPSTLSPFSNNRDQNLIAQSKELDIITVITNISAKLPDV